MAAAALQALNDDLLVGRKVQRLPSGGHLAERGQDRAVDAGGDELVRLAHIDQHRFAGLQPGGGVFDGDRGDGHGATVGSAGAGVGLSSVRFWPRCLAASSGPISRKAGAEALNSSIWPVRTTT